jgi:predicted metalloprotease with PDZ domain
MALTTVLNFGSAQQPGVKYTLGMSQPQTHLYEAEVRFENLPPLDTFDLKLPVWRSGRYLVLDFAGGVQEFSASDGSTNSFSWHKIDKSTWRIQSHGAATVVASYKVYANEFYARTRGLNDEHGFVDGSAVFMYAEQYRHLPLTLKVIPYKDWHVTTGLEPATNDGNTFASPSYDYLVDCPLEIGNQKDFPFEVDGVPHVLSIYGEGNWDSDTLVRDVAKIVKTEKDFWGEFPYKRYVFLLECTPSSGGGTEHINSTAMGITPFVFKNPDTYRGFLALVSHEFFHTWNVKQLRPKGIDPYDYTKENYSEELWIAEGMTDYYSSVMLVRAGFTLPKNYLDRVADWVTNDRSRPGNKLQSVAEASFDAWIKYWKGDQQSYNAESDYYEKGTMVSFLLDMEIRSKTQNKSSLDDAMRAMYKRYPLSVGGYTTADFQKTIEEVTGSSEKEFFDDYVYGVKPLDWKKYCSVAGLEVAPKDSVPKPWTGIRTYDNGQRTFISSLVAGSPGYMSGLDIGDEIVALNGFRIHTSTLTDRIGEMKVGDQVTLTFFQDDKLRTVTFTLRQAPKTYKVTPAKSPTDLQKAVFESWLATKWEKIQQ